MSSISNSLSILIFFSIIFFQISQCIQYCYQIENNSQSPQFWQIIKMSQFDKIFILSAGSLSLILLIMTIYSWIVYKSFSTPSDIMFAIVLSQFIQNLFIVIQAGYFQTLDQYPTQPLDFSSKCFWMGTFQVLGYIGSTYYNLTFCVIFSYSIRNTLKRAFFNPLKYHIISIIIIISLTLIVTLTNSVGLSLNGLCGLRIASRQSIARFILQILVSSICIYSMIKFKSQLPKNQYFQKQSVFGFYFYYMGVFSAIQIIQSLSYLISDIICRLGTIGVSQQLHIFYSISLCVSLMLSYAITFLRWSHPFLRQKLINFCNKNSKNKQKNDQQQPQLQIQQDNSQKENQQTRSWLGNLLQSLKGSQILTFIEGMTIAFVEKQRKYTNNELNSLTFKRNYIFSINQRIIENYISNRISSRQSLLRKRNLGGLNSLEYEVTSFCPQAFSSLTSLQQIHQIINSLSIKKNINLVKKQSYTNGGKSGQFFFCTYDHRLIFKTIKQDETILYLDNIKQFMQYYHNTQNTLIVPILGIFKFQRKDIKEQPFYLMLMNNLTLSSKQNLLRVYDIKGSQFNRSLIRQKNIQFKQEKLRKFTLKDKDFQKLQQKVMINENKANDLKKMLKKDIQFLGSLGLMDYSLLIIKKNGNFRNDRQLAEIKSDTEQGIIYNFGIIDYLQSWNLKRKAQRALKTLITNQQVTANSPINYSNRLSQFIDSIM